VKNGTETDVDCGGSCASKCTSGQHCTVIGDCQAALSCRAGLCVPATCTDGVKNGTETDVDCGGNACPPCANGKLCASNGDCLYGRCTGGLCAQPGCMTIPVGSKPVGVASDGTNVWVANEGSGDVYKIAASTGTVLDHWASGTSAQYLTYDGASIWVTNPVMDTVTKFGQSGPITSYSVGSPGPLYPDGITYDGANIWVANYMGGTVAKLRGSTGELLRTIDVGGMPRFLAFDGTHVWVTVPDERPVTLSTHDVVKKILVKSDDTDSVVGTFDVAPYPSYPYAIVWDGEYIWVTLGTLNTVVKLASTGAFVGSYPTGFGPNGIAFDGTNIWTTNQVCACVPGITPGCTGCPPGTVTKLRASDGVNQGTFNVGRRPQWLTHDGQYLWITNGSDDTVHRCTPF
jgi:DNA-binding beta-propeller fold protein YncE